MGKDKKQSKEKKVDKKKTKSSSKGKQATKKSSSKIGIPRDGSKIVSKTGKKGAAEGGDNGAKVETNRQAISQLVEMVEAVEPNNIDSKTKANLKKIYKLVQKVQECSVKIKMKKRDKDPATSAPPPAAASKVSVSPHEDKGGPADGLKSPPKEQSKMVLPETAKVASSMAPNETLKSPNGEPSKVLAKDGPTSTIK